MQYKYICPFGDEYKFKDKLSFTKHLIDIHKATNVNEIEFALHENQVYQFEKYEIKSCPQ